MMRFLPLFVLTTCFLFACKDKNPCEIGCPYSDKVLGQVALQDTSKNWVPYKGGDRIELRNSNGYSTLLTASGAVSRYSMGASINYRRPCCFHYREYLEFESRRTLFSSSDSLFDIRITLEKNDSGAYDASKNYDEIEDKLVVRINSGYFQFPLNIPGQSIILDTKSEEIAELEWEGEVFTNVIHAYYKIWPLSSAGVQGMYYSKNYGLIGFYQSNGDRWLLLK